jgi:hypothetical protein
LLRSDCQLLRSDHCALVSQRGLLRSECHAALSQQVLCPLPLSQHLLCRVLLRGHALALFLALVLVLVLGLALALVLGLGCGLRFFLLFFLFFLSLLLSYFLLCLRVLRVEPVIHLLRRRNSGGVVPAALQTPFAPLAARPAV